MIEFNLSMDFELAWGDLERVAQDDAFYRRVLAGLEQTSSVIDVLQRNGVPSTWGVVGAIRCESLEQLRETAPAVYRVVNPRIETLKRRRPGFAEVLFCPPIVDTIAGSIPIELASHGLMHLTPGGLSMSVLHDDVSASAKILNAIARSPIRSFIPPQNYSWPDAAFAGSGIRYVRHTPSVFGYAYSDPRRAAKFARLWNDFIKPTELADTRGGRAKLLFLRIDRGERLWNTQLRQIRALLGADAGSLHCFTHPHNLDTPAIVSRFSQMCELVAERRDCGALRFGHFFRELPVDSVQTART